MIQDGAECVVGVVMGGGILDCFADGDAQASGGGGIFFKNISSGLGECGGAWVDFGTPGLHEDASVGFLFVAAFDHVDAAGESEELCGECKGRSPLSCTGFGDESFDSFLFVVVGLGDRGVWFVAAGGAASFPFVVDFCGCFEGGLEASGSVQGAGSPDAVDVSYFGWDGDVSVGAGFLFDESEGEDCFEVVGGDGLSGLGVEGWIKGCFEVCLDVVPVFWNVVFVKGDFGAFHEI